MTVNELPQLRNGLFSLCNSIMAPHFRVYWALSQHFGWPLREFDAGVWWHALRKLWNSTRRGSVGIPHRPHQHAVWSFVQDHQAFPVGNAARMCSISMIEWSKLDYYAAAQWSDWVVVGRHKWRLITARLSLSCSQLKLRRLIKGKTTW